jgi:pyruvate kinase
MSVVQVVTVTADYETPGNATTIACSYPKIAEDLKVGSQILCADGSLVLEVFEVSPATKSVKARAVNTAAIGYAPEVCDQ